MAVCLLESTKDVADAEKKKRRDEAARMMARVPGLRQKIAGKSIPMEVRPSLLLPNPIRMRRGVLAVANCVACFHGYLEICRAEGAQVQHAGVARAAGARAGVHLPGHHARAARRHRPPDAARGRRGAA
jgi:hypothetical protein